MKTNSYILAQIARFNDATITDKDRPEEIRYLDTSSITKNKIERFQNLKSDLPSRARRKVKNNTIIYSTVRPDQEHYGIFEDVENVDNIIVSTGFATIDVINKDISPKFLFYKLTQRHITDYLHAIGEGGVSAYPSINPSDIANLRFEFPELPSQQKIAAVLSALDDKIALNNRINQELEAMAKTLYDYWFVQFDFPDEAGRPYKSSGGSMVYNETLKREIPEGWGAGKIDDLGMIVGGSTPSKNNPENFTSQGTPWITPKDLSLNTGNKFITRGEWDVTERGLKEASLHLLPAFSVLMSSRAPVGYLAINRVACTTNQGFKSIICNKGLSAEYVFYVLQQYMPLIEANATGSTFKEISASVFRSINIVKPKNYVVNSFIEKVKPIFQKQDNLETQNQTLSSLRDWLLPMLMNGQVRVGAAEEEAEAVIGMAAEENVDYK